MKKVIIGYSTHEAAEHTKQFEAKKKAFNDCLNYCNTFLTIEDLKEFSNNMKAYFLMEWEQKYSNSFPPIVSILKQLELSSCQLHIIEAYQTQYDNIDLEFNPNTQDQKAIDFNIYAETPEQIERFASCTELIKAIERLQSTGANILYGSLCQSMQNVLTIDYSTNKLTPVNGFIKNEFR